MGYPTVKGLSLTTDASSTTVRSSELNLMARADAAGQRLFRELVVSRIAWATTGEVSRLIAVDVVAFSLRTAGCDHVQPCEQHYCQDRLELKAVLGNRGSRLPGLRIAQGEGVGGQALETGKPSGVIDYGAAPFDRDLVELVAHEEGIGALTAIPVSFGGDVRGMLHVGLRGERRFSEATVAALTRLCTYAGAAISAARDRARVEEVAAFRERRRLARSLHDDFGQRLFGLGITARAARASATTGGADLIGHLTSLEQQLAGASAAFRTTLNTLARPSRPSGVLAVMLREIAGEFSSRTGVAAHLLVLGDPVELEATTEDLLFKVLHEGLRNVERHAQAAEVIVTLAYTADCVEFVIQDDGIGIGNGKPFGGMGLRMLREEIRQRGGEVRFSRSEDAGTTMRTQVPR